MTAREYQELCMRTASGVSAATPENLLLQGVMGINGEAGEAIDIVKKSLFQGHELDRAHLIEELGDVMWYVATAAKALGVPLDVIMELNISKLRDRYPEGFDSERSTHREET